MRKINYILLCIIIALITGLLGFLVGINLKDISNLDKKELSLLGTYRNNSSNGKESILVLNEDKTCIHFTGNKGIWYIEDQKLYLLIERTTTFNGETTSGTYKQEAEIVDKGIMINNIFFEKLK